MKRLSAILTIAALVLLFHVAHISVCYSADNAADPNIEAMAESGSDMIVPAVASQAVTPVADSSKALIIRIPLPEGKVIITGIIILICLVLAVIYIRRHYKARNTAARESKQTHVLMAQDDAATDVRQDIAASAPTEVTCRQVLQTKMSDSTPCETTAEQQTKIASNVVGQSQETSATSMPASANASNSEHLNGGGSSIIDTIPDTETGARAHLSSASDLVSEDSVSHSETARPDIGVTATANTNEEQDKPAQSIGVPVSASDQDLIVRWTRFAFEEAAGETACCSVFFFVFDRQRHKVAIRFGLFGSHNRSQQHRIALSYDDCAISLFGQFARLDDNLAATAELNHLLCSVVQHSFFFLLF